MEAHTPFLISKPWSNLWSNKYCSLIFFGTIPAKDIMSDEAVYELFSFIFWIMTTISLLKYSFIVLRADDDGEGKLSLVPEIILTGIFFP